MRNQFIASLVEYSRSDSSTFLIVGDLGFGVIEPFADEFPDRILNAGVAEQNMLSMAAGIASTGKTVFVYSIANFPSLRALEQVRNDIAYHQLPVGIVSVGAGLSYGTLGYSHHAVEDVSVMRAIPGLDVYCPADTFEVETVLSSFFQSRKPAYIRLGKGGENPVHNSAPGSIQAGIALRPTTGEFLVLSTGAITASVIAALDELEGEGIGRFSHYSVPAISAIDLEALQARSRKAIITVEEHSTAGGFGSLVLEQLSKSSIFGPTLMIGIKNTKLSLVGSHGYLAAQHELDPKGIASRVKAFLSTR